MDTSETLSFIASRIRGLCDESGISVNELANRSGVSSSTIYALMNRKHANPRIATLDKIRKAFSLSHTEFWSVMGHKS